MSKKLFEIFRAGKYPQGDYPEDKVKAIFENYDPKWWRAPFTIEHLKTSPAYGYVEKLEFADGKLLASPDDISENLRDLIKKKHFGPVSVEIFREIDKDGKKVPYLAAVSFMGVKPPQIKGLEAVQFSELPDQSGTPEVDRLYFRAQGEGDQVELVAMSEDEVAEFTAEGDEPTAGSTTDDFAAERDQLRAQVDTLTTERDEAIAKFTATDAERAASEQKLREINMNIRRLEFESYLNEKLAYGNLSPKVKPKVMKLLLALDQVAMFSEGNEGLVDEFKEFVDSLPKVISTKEVASFGAQAPEALTAKTLGQKAAEFQQQQAEKGIVIPLHKAMQHVKTQTQES